MRRDRPDGLAAGLTVNKAMVAVLTVLTLQAIPPVHPNWCFFDAGGLGTPVGRRSGAGSSVSARTPPECVEKHCFFMPPSATAGAL